MRWRGLDSFGADCSLANKLIKLHGPLKTRNFNNNNNNNNNVITIIIIIIVIVFGHVCVSPPSSHCKSQHINRETEAYFLRLFLSLNENKELVHPYA
jgi:hypothetical protein